MFDIGGGAEGTERNPVRTRERTVMLSGFTLSVSVGLQFGNEVFSFW